MVLWMNWIGEVLSIKRNWCFRDLFYPARERKGAIMVYKYKGNSFIIKWCDGDWGEYTGMFHVENDQPYNFGFTKSVEEMKFTIIRKYEQYHSKIPKTKEEWLDMFSSCIIRDGYEDYHVDEDLAIRLLELYKKYGKVGEKK
jgi:hypothetical protein